MEQTPTILTKEIKDKITSLITIEGLDPENDKQKISDAIGIPVDILKNLFIKERQDRLLKKAEQTSEELLDIDLNDPAVERKFGKAKLQIMKLQLVEAAFIRETLGKDMGYSKRNELTGKGGDAIQIKEILFHAPIPNKIENEKN